MQYGCCVASGEQAEGYPTGSENFVQNLDETDLSDFFVDMDFSDPDVGNQLAQCGIPW